MQISSLFTLVLFGVLLSTSGCSWTSADGRSHWVIIGFGVVTTASTRPITDSPDLLVSGSAVDASGVFVGQAGHMTGVVVGRVKSQQLIVEPNANVLINYTDDDNGTYMKVDSARPRPVTQSASQKSFPQQ